MTSLPPRAILCDMAEPGQNGGDIEATPTPPPERPPSVESLQPPPETPAPPVILPPAPPSIADDTIRHLDARYVELHRTIGVIQTAMLAAVALVSCVGIPAVTGAPGWLLALLVIGGAAVTILVGYLSQRWPVIEHPYHSYRVNTRGIEIQHGVWFRSVVNVARSRIQHTDVSQGPIERRYGLATLHIHTAGTQQAEVALPGLEHATALAIRDYLVTGGEDDAV